MNLEYYIAKRITLKPKRTFSKSIVILSVSAIALSIAIMLISIAIVKGFQTEIKNKVIGFSSHIQVTKSSVNYTFENEPIRFDSLVYQKIRNLKEVKNIHVFATKPGIIKTQKAIEGMVLKGISKDYDWSYIRRVLKEGNILKLTDTAVNNEIVISKSIASKLDLKLHDAVIIYFIQQPPRARKFNICGIFESGLEDIDNTFAVCDIGHIRKLNNWNDTQTGGYEVSLKSIETLEETNERIRAMLSIDQDTKTIQEIYPQIFDWLNLLNMNVSIILILMVIVASVNMVTALLIIILEKSHLIAILKAFGSSNGSTRKIFLYNASFLIAVGVVIGNFLGLSLLYMQYQFHLFKLPVESYYVSFVPVIFNWGQFLLVNIGTFIICSLVMILPATFISRIDPVKTLRFE